MPTTLELKPISHEYDYNEPPSPDRLASYVLDKLQQSKTNFNNLVDNSDKDIKWQYENNRVVIQNYLSGASLQIDDRTQPETIKLLENGNRRAKILLGAHGITRANFTQFFDSAFEAGRIVAAYEATRPHKIDETEYTVDSQARVA